MRTATTTSPSTPSPSPPSSKPDRERYEAFYKKAQELREGLPWNLTTPEEARRFAVWAAAAARFGNEYKDVLMSIFSDLENASLGDTFDKSGQRQQQSRQEGLARLGAAMKELLDLCDAVLPQLKRLEKGLKLMAQTEFSTEGDQRWWELAQYWITLRKQVKDELPPAWSLAIRVRSLYNQLDEQGQAEAESLYGPIRDDSRDGYNVWILMKQVWPGDIIKRFDEIARTEGIYTPEEEQPWVKAQRSAEAKRRRIKPASTLTGDSTVTPTPSTKD